MTHTRAHLEWLVQSGVGRWHPDDPDVVIRPTGGNLCGRCAGTDIPAFFALDWDEVIPVEWREEVLCFACYRFLKTGQGPDRCEGKDPELLEMVRGVEAQALWHRFNMEAGRHEP